jgi:LPXTG-site transpeptidase (sortase) family protein
MKYHKNTLYVLSSVGLVLASILLFQTFVQAHRSPVGCTGSGLQIGLFTSVTKAHAGDTISYSINVYNGLSTGPVVCDASNIQASVVTPDSITHPIALARTALSSGQSDTYSNVVTYIAAAKDAKPDGTLTATASDTGDIHQNDTDSQGGANQGVNVTLLTTPPPPPSVTSTPNPTPTPTPSQTPTPTPTPTPSYTQTPTPTPSIPVTTTTGGGGGGGCSNCGSIYVPPPTPVATVQSVAAPFPNTGIDPNDAETSVKTTFKESSALYNVFPVHLVIPQINVDAALEYVGLTNNGSIGTPTDPTNAAWYVASSLPGENGTAVIDGHYGWKGGQPAVFDRLNELRPGDTIAVTDGQGLSSTFVVRESKTYDKADSATDVFTSNNAGSHLVLVTCEGTWMPSQHSYSGRLVVFADKVVR